MLILHPLLSWKDKMSRSPVMLLGNLILDLLGPKLVAWVKYCHKLQHLLWIMQTGQLLLTTWSSISVQLIMEWDILLLLLQMLLSTVSTSLSLTKMYHHDNSYSSKTLGVVSFQIYSTLKQMYWSLASIAATLGPMLVRSFFPNSWQAECIVCRRDWLSINI